MSHFPVVFELLVDTLEKKCEYSQCNNPYFFAWVDGEQRVIAISVTSHFKFLMISTMYSICDIRSGENKVF